MGHTVYIIITIVVELQELQELSIYESEYWKTHILFLNQLFMSGSATVWLDCSINQI
jgi:hypothetical protein